MSQNFEFLYSYFTFTMLTISGLLLYQPGRFSMMYLRDNNKLKLAFNIFSSYNVQSTKYFPTIFRLSLQSFSLPTPLHPCGEVIRV